MAKERNKGVGGKSRFFELMSEKLPEDVGVYSKGLRESEPIKVPNKVEEDEFEEFRQESLEFERGKNRKNIFNIFRKEKEDLEEVVHSYGDINEEAEQYISEESRAEMERVLRGVVDTTDVINRALANDLNIEDLIYIGYITKNDYQIYLKAEASRAEKERRRIESERRKKEEAERQSEAKRQQEEERKKQLEEEARLREEEEREEKEKLELLIKKLSGEGKEEETTNIKEPETSTEYTEPDDEDNSYEGDDVSRNTGTLPKTKSGISKFFSGGVSDSNSESDSDSEEEQEAKTKPKTKTIKEETRVLVKDFIKENKEKQLEPVEEKVEDKGNVYIVGDLNKVLKNSGVGEKTSTGYMITKEDIDNHITEDLKGYTVTVVQEPSKLEEYLRSKNNLLVLTQDVDKGIAEKLGGILRRLRDDKGVRYRVVTIEGSNTEVKFDVVEEAILLTGEGLDTYYENNPIDNYYDEKQGFSSLDSLL